ncbi:PREDICTED: DEFECTIVE IN MERISTEM [Prunus dulcis]|uniref:PREDICTED: DEFECTIVE IN MERISTEM n=2 Tax=Prunus dulcis TaxID=3755 RepID=A0A5E4E667_PRUDU|nr:PREDICTED: DEFECTIVE IN MERISTEM [Prunus dulcis]
MDAAMLQRTKKSQMLEDQMIRAGHIDQDLLPNGKRKRKRDRDGKGCLFLEDANDRKIRGEMNFKNFKPHECHILKLHDGSHESAYTFENMWDLTPVTDILKELPEEYTFETALADLIDNSLQAVWANDSRHKKLISVDVADDVISIFDTGPGMDGSDEHCIVKWGKMGASLHRSLREQAIGGRPPYLTPFFGMFGYGGPLASMQLGRHALVSSKTKDSRKVYTLHLDREALLTGSNSNFQKKRRGSDSDSNWKTDGGMRDPLEDEISKTPHGSFTKVEIFKPKSKLDISQLQCKLKDIYFPYIQCDEESKSGKTITPVNFEVNGVDLAEIEGGEIAITNVHSCNGPDFVLQLHFSCKQDSMTKSPDSKAYIQANARLKCAYFPMVEGKENIEKILERLESDGCGTSENFETYSRVSIRRLGRLLPDARWARLPFMEFKQKKGDKADLLKICCLRVKCFIETDAGFNPTPSKTNLAHHSPFTTSLRNLGNQPLENEKDVRIKIYRDGNHLTISQLKKEYEDWILQMHERYDDEAHCGEDQPVLVVSPANKKALRISSEVARVHKSLKRKGVTWKCGQKIKLLRGACAGVHNNNVYATIEYFLLEGLEGDPGGGARIICRPLSLSVDKGCILKINDGDTSLDIRDSLSVPVSVIDSGKCLAVESNEWDNQLEKQRQKSPSTIDLLDVEECQELGVDGALPVDAPAGKVPPEVIVAVVRPASYVSSCASKTLDQKYIARTNLKMFMEVEFRSDAEGLRTVRNISACAVPEPRKGIQGLYIFPLKSKYPALFQTSGVYTFSFHLTESNCKHVEKRVLIKQAPIVEYKEIQFTCPNGKAPVIGTPKVEFDEIQVQSSHGKVLPLQDSSSIQQVPVMKAPKVEYDESPIPCPNEKIFLLQDSSSLPHAQNLEASNVNKEKELEKDLHRSGMQIGDMEKNLDALNKEKAVIEQDIYVVQASVERCNSDYCSMKAELKHRIESMSHTAASTLCNLLRVPSQELSNDFMGGVIGLVALLGSTGSSELSRILSEYLGEDQMLAVVCRSFAAAVALEKYEHNGEVDSRHALYAAAAKLGRSINGRFLVISLEDIRPYTGDFDGGDPQRKLALPYPILPSGNIPDGFLGYAVNMVDLDEHHLHMTTAAGHVLRQTLFYFLFGELHVYKTRQDMLAARACIKHGAVSLDGGILRQTGAVSLGYGNPEICFPVLRSVAVMKKKIEIYKETMSAVIAAIEEFTKDHQKALKKFHKKNKKWHELATVKERRLIKTT